MSCSEHAFNKQKTFPSIFYNFFWHWSVKGQTKVDIHEKKKKKYISELLSAIYFMLFNIKKIFHSYLINDKVQSKLVSILLSLLLQSLFFVVLLLSRMNLFYKENCQVQFITWGGNGHLHIVTLLTIKLSMIL